MDRLVSLKDVFETTILEENEFNFRNENLSTEYEASGQADFYLCFMAQEFIDGNWNFSWVGFLFSGLATKWAYEEREKYENHLN
jgi:hypothetical protein